MGENRIRLYRAVPGPNSFKPLVESFGRGGDGFITAFDDAMLPALKGCLNEDSDLQVVPFGVLVRRALEAAGEECRPLATTDQFSVAIGQAARKLRDEAPLKRAARFPGIRKALVRTFSELGEWNIDLDAMIDLADGELKTYLGDLRDIRRDALELLESIGRDTHARQLQSCLEGMIDPDSPATRILVFAAGEAPPAKLEWIKWAVSQRFEAWVVAERHASDGELFAGTAAIPKLLDTELVELGTGNRLLNNLFARAKHPGVEIETAIVSAADSLAECEWALRGCISCRETGSVAIYVRDPSSYVPLLKSAAERLGVTLQIQSRVGLLQNSFARMTLKVLEACASSDIRQLGPVVRSSYLGLDSAKRSTLSSALKEARSRKQRQWEEFAIWLASSEEELPWLGDVLKWRLAALQTPGTLTDWRQRLGELVDLLPWHDCMQAPAGFDPKRDERAFSAMHTSLENEAVLTRRQGEPMISLGEFVRRCTRIWEAADVSVPASFGIPVSSSALAIGSADSVFVLGMLEGVFPRRRTEDPILPDAMREQISALRPEQLPLRTSRDIGAAERDEFYRVCASATESIVFSYPLTDEDRDNVPAFYLEAVKDAGLKVDLIDRPRSVLVPDEKACATEADLALLKALSAPRRDSPTPELTSIAAARLVHVEPEEPIRPEALRDVMECPFRYQMRDRLKVPTKSRQSHWFRLGKLPQVAGLALANDEIDARHRLEEALDSELDLLVAEVSDWELKLLRSGGERLIHEWLRREFKARQIWPREPGTSELNVKVGESGTKALLPGDRTLRGNVPVLTRLEGGTRMLQIYGARAGDPEEMSDSDRLFLGLYFRIGFEAGRETALELDGFDGRRSLVVLSRTGIRALRSDVQNGLQVLDLSTTDDALISKKQFHDSLRLLIEKAIHRIDRGDIRPVPGQYCETCDFGELCRRSTSFSDDDSPFEEDDAIGAA